MEIVKPVLKWVGGKTQIIDKVIDAFPNHMNNYHEPFIGGGSVLLALLSHVAKGDVTIAGTVYASDKNTRLIALYENIQQKPEELIAHLKALTEEFASIPSEPLAADTSSQHAEVKTGRKKVSPPKSLQEAKGSQEHFYYWIRHRYNQMAPEEQTSPMASAYFIFLNKTCFRGVYREGPKGFNVPFGHYKSPGVFDEHHIRQVSVLFKDVIFKCQSFEDSLQAVQQGDFIYLDPPYAPETNTSFVGYTADGFNAEHHSKLFTLCQDLTKIPGVGFVMSNADVEYVRNNFPEEVFRVEVINCKRSINSKKPGSKTNEVIITWVENDNAN